MAPEMILPILSVAALFLGPWLFTLTRRHAALAEGLDAFITVAILVLVVFDVIPESLETLGWPALLALGSGLVLPLFLHGPLHHCVEGHSAALVALAVCGLGLHAFLDGTGLFVGDAGRHPAAVAEGLAVAVVLHRVLEGMANLVAVSYVPWPVADLVCFAGAGGGHHGRVCGGGVGDAGRVDHRGTYCAGRCCRVAFTCAVAAWAGDSRGRAALASGLGFRGARRPYDVVAAKTR